MWFLNMVVRVLRVVTMRFLWYLGWLLGYSGWMLGCCCFVARLLIASMFQIDAILKGALYDPFNRLVWMRILIRSQLNFIIQITFMVSEWLGQQ